MNAPYHAHIYYEPQTRDAAARLHRRFREASSTGDALGVLFVGDLRDRPLGPHPLPQFEIHFDGQTLPQVLAVLEPAGLRALVHPLTYDDLADHTTLARWIGAPLELDLSVLDPPGINQGIARFGKSDF